RASGVVVARADEAEVEATRLGGIVEVRDRERVLRRVAGAVVEGRVEAVRALPAVLPVVHHRARHGAMADDPGLQGVGARRDHALVAVRGFRIAAPAADDLTRLPAAG